MQVVEKKVANKAVVILLFTMVIFLFLSFQNIEAAEIKIGLVNLAEVISGHPYTQNINQLSINLREELQKRQEELNAQGKGLDETGLKKLEDKFNKEWNPIKEKILAEIKLYQAARYSHIIEAIKAVGDTGKYDLIINSEIKVPAGTDILNYPIALYGGEDITQDVIAEIVRKLEEERKEWAKKQKSAKIFERKGQAAQFMDNQPYFYDKSGMFWLWNSSLKYWEICDDIDILNFIEESTNQDIISSRSRTEILNSLKQHGRKNIPKEIIDMYSFLKHSLACGILSRIIAARKNFGQTEQLFVSGLLHDLGRLILYMYFTDESRNILSRSRNSNKLLYEEEQDYLGYDHAQVGKQLMEQWKLPLILENNVLYHHKPSEAQQPIPATIVHLADIIVNSLGIGSSGEKFVPPLDLEAWENLQLPLSSFETIIGQATHQFYSLESLLQL